MGTKMKIVCIIQARMGSTRLPGKVMMPLGDENAAVLAWVHRACMAASRVDEVVVATSTEKTDNAIVQFCKRNEIECVRGPEDDVLARYVKVAKEFQADAYLRVTADEPFIDPYAISLVAHRMRLTGAHYVSNIHPRTWPDGCDVEAFTHEILTMAHENTTRPIDRECVTTWMVRNAHKFSSEAVINPLPGMQDERWVLDTKDDYEFCKAIADRWPWEKGPPSQIDILGILECEPDIRNLNKSGVMNERYYEALAEEDIPPRNYETSKALLARAEQLIPLGAQTYSKSKLQFPSEAPLFLTHGQGGLVCDVDGNEYVDLVSALLPNVLGYRDPDVDEAIRRQQAKGISFSLATSLEADLAERLVEIIPCAEMARFGKSGTDVTTAAVRLARAVTGRTPIVTFRGGYHGWAEWSLINDSVRNGGCLGQDSIQCWRDIKHVREVVETLKPAAIIIEPEAHSLLLKNLRSLCDETGTILIFDEVITGFRYALGGAQEYYNITPDLATFGKALGNGMPISALVGRREIMSHMTKISYSGTMFGETLSIAAAIAVIDKMRSKPVIQTIWDTGQELREALWQMIYKHELVGQVIVSGVSALIRIHIDDPHLMTLWRQEMLQAGVLIIASHNICYAHSKSDIRRVVKAYDKAFGILREAIDADDVQSRIIGQPISASSVRAA
jgi:glutamate-1-semialdehyde 2,1-aminomutase